MTSDRFNYVRVNACIKHKYKPFKIKKMKNRIITAILSLGLTLLLLTGCSKMPQAEIDAANNAIEQAKSAGADVYTPESYIALQDSMKGVMAGIESQKSGLFRKNSKAKEQLAGVTQLAEEVKQEAEARKEQIKVEIQNTIAETKNLIQSNRQLILEAPKGKEGTSALVAIKGEIDAVESSINDTTAFSGSENYVVALDKAKAAKEKAVSINSELSNVIAKYKANVKKRKS